MVESKHYIYKTLDNEPRILYWPIDEFLVMVLPVFCGIVFGCFFLMLGSFLKVPYTRIKKRLSHRSTVHYAYWHLPTDYMKGVGHFKSLPPTHHREYLL